MISCSNNPEQETGEIKTFNLVKTAFLHPTGSTKFVDSRTLISRQQIDNFNIPILFVELESGQNGTLTGYPGQGDGKTWLGADGATLTFNDGVIKASRGMGNDVMGGTTSKRSWSSINNTEKYKREIKYLDGNNKIYTQVYECRIKRLAINKTIKIWDVNFEVDHFEENCDSEFKEITKYL